MLSVVMATHNEAKNIERCLKALSDIADEIIVVDGESTDDTVAIAKKLGARVISTTNKPIFHINKQMAMDEAKGELVLQMDADEVVDDELKRWIKQLHSRIKKTKNLDDFPEKAWWIRRKNLFLGRFMTKGGQYPDPVIRLYLNGYARLPQKDVHEQMAVDGPVGWADGHLIHYANPSFEDYLRKFNTYTSLNAQFLHEEETSVSLSTGLRFLIWKPFATWFSLFIRHKGFMDGVPGFVFALFSGLYHAVSYLKLWEVYRLEHAKKS